jgi:fructose-1-phosphate kinase PfkB-like protein
VPEIKVVNTIGSGDSMVAGFASGLARGYTLEEAFRLAMACAVTNAQYMEIGFVDVVNVQKHLEGIRIRSLDIG